MRSQHKGSEEGWLVCARGNDLFENSIKSVATAQTPFLKIDLIVRKLWGVPRPRGRLG